jgi:hypothetical protein
MSAPERPRLLNIPDSSPEVCVLSNGRYNVMFTASGGGSTTLNGIDITRWRQHRTRDCFTADGPKDLITLRTRERLPAPWANVLANPAFGCLITETRSCYTWASNSQTNQLTPWGNNPLLVGPNGPGRTALFRSTAGAGTASISLGEQQLLALTRLIAARPAFAMLDRLYVALKPARVRQALRSVNENSITYVALAEDIEPVEVYDAVLKIDTDGARSWKQTGRSTSTEAANRGRL